jgi:hypothetical protein
MWSLAAPIISLREVALRVKTPKLIDGILEPHARTGIPLRHSRYTSKNLDEAAHAVTGANRRFWACFVTSDGVRQTAQRMRSRLEGAVQKILRKSI